ncbi:MAG: DUF2177 family protein [Hyphomicrobiaceae bacterium]
MSVTLSSFARAALVSALVLGLLDAVWIPMIAGPMFKVALGDAMLGTPRLAPALAFYTLYPVGLTLLAVRPALLKQSLQSAILLGATTGALAYGTFDLTNLALLEAYSLRLALVDWAWGTFASSASAAAGFLVAQRTSTRATSG